VDNQLARFERLFERLVEDPLIRLFSGELRPQELVARLGRAMEDGAEGKRAPDHYQVLLNPDDREALLAVEPELVQYLADEVCVLAEQAGLNLPTEPVVELRARAQMPRQTVRVAARVTGQGAQQTQSLDRERLRRQAALGPDGSTYLIVGGQQHVPLTRTIYTLGRRLDCDVVLSDPTVSRRHAQLRWRFGRYVLYDLGSSAGTRVNGHPVAEAVLEPGDVIRLGAVDIIYGQDAGDSASRPDDSSTRTWTRPKVLL
jgi:hypothetical protein